MLVVMLGMQVAEAQVPTLSDEEADIVAHGEISVGRWIMGGIFASSIGFGIGHAIQGRWRYTGWIFTAGEAASVVAVGYAGIDMLINSDHRGKGDLQPYLLIGGLVLFGGLKIWEGVDGWVGPPRQNRRYRELLQRTGNNAAMLQGAAPYLAPIEGGGAVGGLAFRL